MYQFPHMSRISRSNRPDGKQGVTPLRTSPVGKWSLRLGVSGIFFWILGWVCMSLPWRHGDATGQGMLYATPALEVAAIIFAYLHFRRGGSGQKE